MTCRLQRAVSEGGVPRRGRTERAKTKRSSVDNQMNQWESQEVRQSNTPPLCKWYMEHLGVHNYEGFQPWQCWLMTLLSMVVTEAAVRIYHLLLKRKSAA